MIVKCSYCGKEFNRFPSQIRKNNFCSNECRYKHRRKSHQNTIRFCKCCAVLEIIKNNQLFEVKIDIEDIEKIKKYTWHLHYDKKRDRYDACTNAERCKKRTSNYLNLARYIMNCPKGLTIDHINHNTLDNRKQNLRICTNIENQQNKTNNSSGCVGVVWDKNRGKWKATVGYNNKIYNLGRFNSFNEAVIARKNKEAERGLFFPSSNTNSLK